MIFKMPLILEKNSIFQLWSKTHLLMIKFKSQIRRHLFCLRRISWCLIYLRCICKCFRRLFFYTVKSQEFFLKCSLLIYFIYMFRAILRFFLNNLKIFLFERYFIWRIFLQFYYYYYYFYYRKFAIDRPIFSYT